tara:strand:+ start:192 stop:878 length:687 start_codon:yes stop_codon:yes gene_type:complete
MKKSDIQYFHSGCGARWLSNFAQLDSLQIDGRDWPSVEHWYQATKFHPDDREAFAVGGRLATLDAISENGGIFFAPKVHAKKIKYWGRKSTGPSMVGIIAKMASKPGRAEKLGLRMLPEPLTESTDRITELTALFKRGLHAKYEQNPVPRRALLLTGKRVLVEFGKSAGREIKAGRPPPLWTGLWHKETEKIVGYNLMGEIMMEVRGEMFPPINDIQTAGEDVYATLE